MKANNRKIFITLILLISFTSLTYEGLVKKKRAILIGVDGFFQYCYDKATTTAFDRLKNEGSYTFNSRSGIEAVSGPGWTNILCGLDSEDSGVFNNDWVPPSLTRKWSPILPVTGYNQLPCIFEELKKNNKSLKVKVSHAWDFLLYFGNEFNPGFMDIEKYCGDYSTLETTDACDKGTKDNTIQFIKDDFDFIFTYFGSVDETGHLTGFCKDRYIQQLSTINSHVDEILKELETQGILDDTLIILTTDHGAEKDTTWHGAQNDDNLLIPYFIRGPGIKKNYEIKQTLVENNVTPVLITNFFGFPSNEFWRGKVPNEIYDNPIAQEGFLKSTK